MELQLLSPIHHDVHKDKFTGSETCTYMNMVIFILTHPAVLYYTEYKQTVALIGRRVSYEIRFTNYVQELNKKRRKCKKNTKIQCIDFTRGRRIHVRRQHNKTGYMQNKD